MDDSLFCRGSGDDFPGDAELIDGASAALEKFGELLGVWAGTRINEEGGAVGETGFDNQSNLVGIDCPARGSFGG